MRSQSKPEVKSPFQHSQKVTGKLGTNTHHLQPRDIKTSSNVGYNLHKRNNSEAQPSKTQHFMGHKRASEHYVDISQQYVQHLQRQLGDVSK